MNTSDDFRRIVEIAKSVLEGKVRPVEGAHKLYPLVIDSNLVEPADADVIAGVVSTTDHLPIGTVRDHWDKDALKGKDRELDEADRRWGHKVAAICANILEKEC